jgi:hypothetical protein
MKMFKEKIKATVVKSVLVNAGSYRTKSFRNASAAAKFYANRSNENYYMMHQNLGLQQIDARCEKLYRRVLPIFKRMLK